MGSMSSVLIRCPFEQTPGRKHTSGPQQVCSTMGEISSTGVLGEIMGTVRLLKTSVLLMAASYLLWLAAPSYAWLVGFATVLGLGYGLRISLMPAVLSRWM